MYVCDKVDEDPRGEANFHDHAIRSFVTSASGNDGVSGKVWFDFEFGELVDASFTGGFWRPIDFYGTLAMVLERAKEKYPA